METNTQPTASAAAAGGAKTTVVYDGACRVCGKLARLLQAWDRQGRLEVVPSGGALLKERFPDITRDEYEQSLQVITPDGTRYQRGDAIEKLLQTLPMGWLLSWVFRIPGARGLVDRFYRWFASNRYWFGCGETCPIHVRRKQAMRGG
jgi:predicted DCC family thiol-disulfide oxidoreductase YuxK